jgi:hypothetical protein
MKRAAIERPRTVCEWKVRQFEDEFFEPGYFRKGRTARGCPRWCYHCRAKKRKPPRKLVEADWTFHEWLEEIGN